MVEIEQRFKITTEEYDDIVARFDWTAGTRVCDLTFGPSGATSMQTHGWVIRLRQTDDSVRMEYKSPANEEWSAWVEYSITVDDFGHAAKILQSAGLQPGLLLDRVRRTASSDGISLSLDDVRGLGKFIEIEVRTQSASDSEAHEAIARMRDELNLPEGSAARPYGELLLHRLADDPELRNELDSAIATMMPSSIGM